jgi:hypothetical protein
MGAAIARVGFRDYGKGMGVLGRLRTALFGARPEIPAVVHLQAARALLVDVRRCVAISEALAAAARTRLEALEPERTRWEVRRRRSPEDVAERVDGVLERLAVDIRDARSALKNAERSVREGIVEVERCAVELVRLRQVALAYGADVAGLDLQIDEPAIRLEAERSVDALLKPHEYREDEERDFLDALFLELEKRGVSLPAVAVQA